MKSARMPELICPAGTPAALHAAVDAGADAVYAGFQDETNARNFPGLNFTTDEMATGIKYAHRHARKVFIAINTYPQAGKISLWRQAVDNAAKAGADAAIIADIGLAEYARKRHPALRLHLSVQASASNPEAISYFVKNFGVKRVVLPRVLSVPEISALQKNISCETEVFVFGGLCVMAEGRCALSSYCTGKSPNMNGVCSPASHVRYSTEPDGTLLSRLGDFTINRYKIGENAAYPTLCKGRFVLNEKSGYIFEDPVSLNAANMIPELLRAGVSAFKIEGRQRSRAYIAAVVKSFRAVLDAAQEGVEPPAQALTALAEGQNMTEGAYNKKWR